MEKLKLLPHDRYHSIDEFDPLRYYFWPVLGGMYRKRVEFCLHECKPGPRVLDVGFGAGVTFLNLHDKYEEIYGVDLTADLARVGKVFQDHAIPVNLSNGNVLDMEYPDAFFDTVLLISILEHLKPDQQIKAFKEINRAGKAKAFGVSNFHKWEYVALRDGASPHRCCCCVVVRDGGGCC